MVYVSFFGEFWLKFPIWSLLSLNVEKPIQHDHLYCLSIDESRDTTKNCFTSLIVIMWKKKIRGKWFKIYLKLKYFLHWFEKYLFGDQQIFEPEVLIKFRKELWNWAFSRSYSQYGHVTHHFASFLLLITIYTFSVGKKHSGTKNREINNFLNFF